jgi:uncharacterized membrane protein
MNKKTYLAIVVIIAIILYAALILRYQANISALDDVFGYMYYAVIAVGIIGLIWFLAKYPRKASTTT